MSWYRTGTVTVANGSAAVTGAGTDFVQNTQTGEAFRGPDGRTYEIAGVVSATELTLAEAYMGGSGGGQTYAIQPTASFARDLALRAANLLNTFGAVRDGVGQGLFPDGTVAAPGIRFAADQDTGLRRAGADSLALVTGGVDRLHANTVGAHVYGRVTAVQSDPTGVAAPALGSPASASALFSIAASYGLLIGTFGIGGHSWMQSQRTDGTPAAYDLLLQPSGGNLLVGDVSGSSHKVRKNGAQGVQSFEVFAAAAFFNSDGAGFNGSATAMVLTRNTATGRSLNAAGTVNASGADYAEYMTKSDGCGTIAKGDVCGIDGDGHLTRKWADARSFVIKSTDPSYVGGDVWGQSVGPRPEGPGEEPAAPITPPAAPESEDEADVAAWRAIVAAYPAQQAAHQSAHAAWTTAKAAYDTALPAWEAALEVERQKVDRIAFAGQVPVNVTGDFAVGDYIIAAASGAGIKAVAVPEADITFDQYRRRLGKVWAVRDGRAWVDVQHG